MACTTQLTFTVLQDSAHLGNDVMPELIKLATDLVTDFKGPNQNGLNKVMDKAMYGDVDAEWETLKSDLSNICLNAFQFECQYPYLVTNSNPPQIDPTYNVPRYITATDGFLCFPAGDTGAVNNYLENVVAPAFPANYRKSILTWMVSAIPSILASGGESWSKQKFSQNSPSITNPNTNDGYQVDAVAVYNTCNVSVAGGGTEKKSFVQFAGVGYYVQPDPPALTVTGGARVYRITTPLKDLAITLALTHNIYTAYNNQVTNVKNKVIVETGGTFNRPVVNVTIQPGSNASGGGSGGSGGSGGPGNSIRANGKFDTTSVCQAALDEFSKAGFPVPAVVQDVATDIEMAAFAYISSWDASAK